VAKRPRRTNAGYLCCRWTLLHRASAADRRGDGSLPRFILRDSLHAGRPARHRGNGRWADLLPPPAHALPLNRRLPRRGKGSRFFTTAARFVTPKRIYRQSGRNFTVGPPGRSPTSPRLTQFRMRSAACRRKISHSSRVAVPLHRYEAAGHLRLAFDHSTMYHSPTPACSRKSFSLFVRESGPGFLTF
jgi:hypothetical protein